VKSRLNVIERPEANSFAIYLAGIKFRIQALRYYKVLRSVPALLCIKKQTFYVWSVLKSKGIELLLRINGLKGRALGLIKLRVENKKVTVNCFSNVLYTCSR
jgi:hypothetical protein